jgi:hypothetical protein
MASDQNVILFYAHESQTIQEIIFSYSILNHQISEIEKCIFT